MNYDEQRLKKLRKALGRDKCETKEKVEVYKVKQVRITKPYKLSRKTIFKQKLGKILRGPDGKEKDRLNNLKLGIISTFKGKY